MEIITSDLDNVWSLIAILADPVKTREAIEELRSRLAELNAASEASARELDEKRVLATREIEKATREHRLSAAALAEAKALEVELSGRKKDLETVREEYASREQEIREWNLSLQTRDADLKKREEEYAQRKLQLDRLASDLEARRVDLDRKLMVLKQAAAA